jgi:chromosome segregation ATPase
MVAIVVVSLWRAGSVEQQKQRIARDYEQAKTLLAQLEQEHTNLSSELSLASRTMAGQAIDISDLQAELSSVQHEMDQTTAELALLQRDHERLRQQNTSLTNQLGSVVAEKQQLQARLSSLKELRLAIRDVKQRMHDERWAAWRARAEAQRTEDERLLALGNRGYLVRDGESTTGSAARLRVHVREPQAAP